MRYLRMTVEPDPSIAPEAFRIIADSDSVREARLEEWNVGGDDVTLFYAIEGDVGGVRESLAETAEVEAVNATAIGEATGSLLVRLDPSKTRIGERIFDLMGSQGLIVRKPVIYREGTVHAGLVGEDDAIQVVIDHLPPGADVDVKEIRGTVPRPDTVIERLSERQREALRIALEIGYYDKPRRATHETVAERMGCAPSTATEHLQKAEATLVRETMGEFGLQSTDGRDATEGESE